jgi:undecaprenyl-diphosphatase
MDQQVFFLINHTWAMPAMNYVMAVASSWDFWWPILVAVGLLVLIFGGFRARVMLLAIGLSVGITDALVVDTVKGLVGRPRPHEVLEGVRTLDLARAKPRLLALGKPLREEYSTPRILPPHGNSFPSGHASNNFAMATVVALFYRRWGWMAFGPALLVSYSRIYVGSHWPLDVVVSCLIGAGIGALVVAALEGLWRRYGERWMPRLHALHPGLLCA